MYGSRIKIPANVANEKIMLFHIIAAERIIRLMWQMKKLTLFHVIAAERIIRLMWQMKKLTLYHIITAE